MGQRDTFIGFALGCIVTAITIFIAAAWDPQWNPRLPTNTEVTELRKQLDDVELKLKKLDAFIHATHEREMEVIARQRKARETGEAAAPLSPR